jgi:hypothetical protein
MLFDSGLILSAASARKGYDPSSPDHSRAQWLADCESALATAIDSADLDASRDRCRGASAGLAWAARDRRPGPGAATRSCPPINPNGPVRPRIRDAALTPSRRWRPSPHSLAGLGRENKIGGS